MKASKWSSQRALNVALCSGQLLTLALLLCVWRQSAQTQGAYDIGHHEPLTAAGRRLQVGA